MEDVDADAFNAFESSGVDRRAPTYDDFLGQITREVVPTLLDAADVGKGSRVLDVATGPGYAAAAAHARGASVVGVDVATAMVQLAASRYPGIDFRAADAETLLFEDGSFDAVVSNFIVPHLGRPEQAVGELARVLEVGGALRSPPGTTRSGCVSSDYSWKPSHEQERHRPKTFLPAHRSSGSPTTRSSMSSCEEAA